MARTTSGADDGQWSFGDDTLSEARRRVKANLDKGSCCPCCGQYARRYKRTLYSSQAAQLIRLYWLNRRDPEKYFHRHIVTPRCNNGDLVFLRHWGLLEVEPNEDPTKKDSGSFRITELGRQFVERKARVPKSLFQYNDNVEEFTEETTDIVEALKEKFNYEDLMGGGSASA